MSRALSRILGTWVAFGLLVVGIFALRGMGVDVSGDWFERYAWMCWGVTGAIVGCEVLD